MRTSHPSLPTRRRLLACAAAGSTLAVTGRSFAQQVLDAADMRPGQYTWHPERQASGPVAVIVSLPEQRVHVYRNGVRIAVATCSTGKPGHATPTGVFVVLEKDRRHRSSTYNNAPMPNMNRLTWSGIALHAGALPGYPASHGCVRLPLAFSEKLFGLTHLGTPVIIAGRHDDPWELTHPGMILSAYAGVELGDAVSALAARKRPSDWLDGEAYPVISILVSSADKRIVLIENGSAIAEGALTLRGQGPLGDHVLILKGADGAGLHWAAVTYKAGDGSAGADAGLLGRLASDDAFVARMREKLHPGAVLVTTDLPLTPDRRSGQDFVIMT